MAGIKLSQLPETVELTDEDYLMITQNGSTKKVKASLFLQNGGDDLPLGTILEWCYDTLPIGFLWTDHEYKIEEYKELYNLLGDKYNIETTLEGYFRTPTKAGLISIGAGTNTDKNGKEMTFEVGKKYGEYEHKITIAETAKHSHQMKNQVLALKQTGIDSSQSGPWFATYEKTDEVGGDQAHNNIQPSVAVKYIIKAIRNKVEETNVNLNEKVRLLEKNQIKGIATGESIHVEDTAECMAKLDLQGNSKQEIRSGKNKFNLNDVVTTSSSIKYTKIDDNSFTLSTTSSTAWLIQKVILHNLKANQSYTLKFNQTNTNTKMENWLMVEGRNSANELKTFYNKSYDVSSSLTFNTETYNTTVSICFYVSTTTANVGSNTATITNIQLEEGTVATLFEKFGAMPSFDFASESRSCKESVNLVVCNKNYFDAEVVELNADFNTTSKVRVKKGGKYRLSSKDNNVRWEGNLIFYKNYDDNVAISQLFAYQNAFVVPANCNYIKLVGSKTALPFGAKIQLEEVSSDQNSTTLYLEHKEQVMQLPLFQKLRSLGNVRDQIIYKNDKWQIEQKIGCVIFDGSDDEAWYMSTPIANDNSTWFQSGQKPSGIIVGYLTDNTKFRCNKLKTYDCFAKTNIEEGTCIHSNGGVQVRIKTTRLESQTVSGLQKFLQSNNLEVEYLLAEPIYTNCTEEQKAVLDQLQNLLTYEDVTNIYCTDEIAPFMSMQYNKSLKSLDQRISVLEKK